VARTEGAVDVLVMTMNSHIANEKIAFFGCHALRNIGSHNQDDAKLVASAGAREVLHKATKHFPSLWDMLQTAIHAIRRKMRGKPPKFLLSDFERKGALGEGGYGAVSIYLWKSRNLLVAGKTNRLDRTWDEEAFKKEAETHYELSAYEGIVDVYGIIVDDTAPTPSYIIIMELMSDTLENQFVKRLREPKGSLAPLRTRVWVLYQTALGLKHLHDAGIIHSDIKPMNVLLTGDECDVARLTDFGLSKLRHPVAATQTMVERAARDSGTPFKGE
jgi:serine/threonine protein kinase